MEEKVYSMVLELKLSIESWNLDNLYNSLDNFKKFFISNKKIFYHRLTLLTDNSEIIYKKQKFKKYFKMGLLFFEWKFNDIYLYQNEDIAEIYENLNYIIFLLKLFKKHNNNYDIFFEILFEIYNHLLLTHIENLLVNKHT